VRKKCVKYCCIGMHSMQATGELCDAAEIHIPELKVPSVDLPYQSITFCAETKCAL